MEPPKSHDQIRTDINREINNFLKTDICTPKTKDGYVDAKAGVQKVHGFSERRKEKQNYGYDPFYKCLC